MSDTYGHDTQDQSEIFDEDMTDNVDSGPRQHELKTFEELPDVLDVTAASGDGFDDDVGLDAADFEDGVLDDDDLEEDEVCETAGSGADGDDVDPGDAAARDEGAARGADEDADAEEEE